MAAAVGGSGRRRIRSAMPACARRSLPISAWRAVLPARRARSSSPPASGMALALFAEVALDAGDAAWIEEPGFVGVRDALAAASVRAVPVRIDEAGFSPEAAQEAAPEARLAVVAPAASFPAGRRARVAAPPETPELGRAP